MRLLVLAAAVVLPTALAFQTQTPPASTPSQPATSQPATQPTFAPVPFLTVRPVRTFREPGWVIDPARKYRAVLTTSQGEVTLDLYAREAPKAVNNFVFLALNHFYDDTPFTASSTASWRRAATRRAPARAAPATTSSSRSTAS
jgi:peptidylprolyl isomerase